MDVMSLVPQTKMVDVAKLNSLGNLLARRTTCLMLRTTSATSIFSHVFGAYSMTRIPYKYFVFQHFSSFSPFYLQGQHTLFNVTSRENTLTLSISTNRLNTLFLFFTFDFQLLTATKLYTPCNHSLPSYNFSVKLFPALNRNFVKPQTEINSRNT